MSRLDRACLVDGCLGLAVFGFGLSSAVRQVWACGAHRHLLDGTSDKTRAAVPPPAPAGAEVASHRTASAPTVSAPQQGRLFG